MLKVAKFRLAGKKIDFVNLLAIFIKIFQILYINIDLYSYLFLQKKKIKLKFHFLCVFF